MHYSVKPRDRIFVKDCRFLSFAKNMSKNISKNVGGKYSQNFLIVINNLQQIHLKLLQKNKSKKQ